MKSKSAEKVRLTSFDDLFGAGEAPAGETVTFVSLSQLHTFKGHPFRVLDDEKMQETVESVKQYGVLIVTRHFIVDEKSILFSTV